MQRGGPLERTRGIGPDDFTKLPGNVTISGQLRRPDLDCRLRPDRAQLPDQSRVRGPAAGTPIEKGARTADADAVLERKREKAFANEERELAATREHEHHPCVRERRATPFLALEPFEEKLRALACSGRDVP